MTEQAVTLEYGKTPARRWWRWARPVAVMLGCAAIAIGGWQILSSPRVRLLYWQRQCLRYSPPPTAVAYDETPTAAATVVGEDVVTIADSRGGGTEMAYREPYCFAQLRADFTVARTDFLPPAPVLLHGLDAGGGERLVVVSVQRAARDQRLHGAMPSFGNTLLLAWAAHPATWTSDPSATSRSWDCPELATPPEVGHLRIYAAQLDPGDRAHFTIACDTATGTRTIDGWLQPDDTLKFALRPAPATAPTTAPAGGGSR